MYLSLECEREDDGRWLAEVAALPSVLAYGASANEGEESEEPTALNVASAMTKPGTTTPANEARSATLRSTGDMRANV